MSVKEQKPIVIFRGDNTAAFDLRTIKILLTGDLDLTNATARFDLLGFTKSWTTEEVATGELSIVFDAAQTKAFALGPQTGTLRLFDMSTGTPRQLTVVNKIPFFVTNNVCEIDSQSYGINVSVTSGETIHIEFNVGLDAVEGKADKVEGATAGDLASLTEDGNLEDSGIPKTDVQRKLTFDSTPTEGSQNPVTSDGIKRAIDAATPEDYAQVKAQVEQNTGDIATNTENISKNTGDISAIEAKIPEQASALNQLADKDFVNSSIATNTANFLGTYDYVADLGFPQPSSSADVSNAAIATALGSLTFQQTPTNNDYVFVQIDYTATTPADEFRRFKFNGTAWAYEYTLNNSSFTANQWAAINSGITSGAVEKLAGIEAGAQVNAIETVKVNGTAITPDGNKAVDVTVPQASDAAPIVAGAATAGSSNAFSRGDHVHPTDTTRAPLASPALTGTPTAPTPTTGDDSTRVATTEFVQDGISAARRTEASDVIRHYIEWSDPIVVDNTAGGYAVIYFTPTAFGATANCIVRSFTVKSASNSATLPTVPVYAKIIDPDATASALAVSQPVSMSATSTDYTFVFDKSPSLTYNKQYRLVFASGAADGSAQVAVGVSLRVMSGAQDIYYAANTTWRPKTKWVYSQSTFSADFATKTELRYSIVSPTLTYSTTTTANDTVAATLNDRAVNNVTLDSSVAFATFTFPATVSGKARDFILRLTLTGETVPTITFREAGGAAVSFDVDDDAWAEVEPGVNILSFTDTNEAL